MDIKTETHRGILHPQEGKKKFQLTFHAPAPDISFFVEFYWAVKWDLRGQEPYPSETLPHPCVHLVIEQGQSGIFGVVRGKFTHLLENKGRAFAVKFKPGAFYPFIKSPVSAFTDSVISLREAFGVEGHALEEAILAEEDEGAAIKLMDDFLSKRLPEQDENVSMINQIIDGIIADREITKVDNVVHRFGLNKRTLQRLFSQYVGVSPKWVIKRYRLHEAAEQLEAGAVVDWAKLAQDLGYFDQAHFIKDFKTIVGKAPAEYAKYGG